MYIKQKKFSEPPCKMTLRLEAKTAAELRRCAQSKQESISQVLNRVIKSGLKNERSTAA